MAESFNDYFKRHVGKIVKVDGISYKIKYYEFKAKYPYPHNHVTINLDPVNKHSEYYLKIKRKLGDDWSTDIASLSDKSLMQIVKQLGRLK